MKGLKGRPERVHGVLLIADYLQRILVWRTNLIKRLYLEKYIRPV